VELLVTIALRELKADRCACLRKKIPSMSFCGGCYHELPKDMQMKLYARVGSGYEQYYDEAKKWLRANTNRMLNAPKGDEA
jgi:hypothetical protein